VAVDVASAVAAAAATPAVSAKLGTMVPVLIIDDDEALGALLIEYMAGFSIALDQSLEPLDGLERVAQGPVAGDADRYRAVILDVMLPGMTGFDVCRRIRQDSDVPIVMLTARGDVTDRIVGLELGADDYLPKPFEPRELVARLLANVKRPLADSREAHPDEALRRFGSLSIDSARRAASIDGVDVGLTTMEFDLVALLSAQPGRAFSRDEILAVLKGAQHELFSRSVDILVSRTRAKLRPLEPLRTVHRAGYAFIAPD